MISRSDVPTDVASRFWRKVDRRSPSECWPWLGYISPSGYGVIGSHQVGTRYAHRISYLLHHGYLNDGLVLDHLCRQRECVNPDHLEQVTIGENVMRGETVSAAHAAKTRCPQGHEYNKHNTYMYRGRRHCRSCQRAHRRKWGERNQ